MEKQHYGHGSRGIERSLPTGDKEEGHPINSYPSQVRKIQREIDAKAERAKVLETREKFGELRKMLGN